MRTFVVNVIVTAWQGDLTKAFSERREQVNFTDIYVREVWNKNVCCIPSLHQSATRILNELRYAARTKSQLNKQAKHTTFYNFAERISFAELEAGCRVVWVPLDADKSAQSAFFQLQKLIRKKKRDILSEKRDSGMVLKKRVGLRPKAVMLTRVINE